MYKYDANGNIEYLSRNDHHANPMDQLDYTYPNNLNNQLTSVDDRQGAADLVTSSDYYPGVYTERSRSGMKMEGRGYLSHFIA